MSTKEELIKTLKSFRETSDYTERVKKVKAYLLSHYVGEKAFKTNEEASNKSDFINENYKKLIWSKDQGETINFKNVIGGDHCDYINKSPVQMIINEAKRMKTAFYCLSENPEYFFNDQNKKHGDPISYTSFIDRDGKNKFIASQGNHRTAMGIYLQSICYADDIQINNVPVCKAEIDYELIDLINITNEQLASYEYSLYIEKKSIYTDEATYQLINRLSLYNKQEGYLNNLYLKYDKNNLENSIIKNDEKIISYLDNCINFIPKKEKVSNELKQITKSSKNIFTRLLGN